MAYENYENFRSDKKIEIIKARDLILETLDLNNVYWTVAFLAMENVIAGICLNSKIDPHEFKMFLDEFGENYKKAFNSEQK
jgi:hypothetical protein